MDFIPQTHAPSYLKFQIKLDFKCRNIRTRINCITQHKKKINPYTFGGLGIVSEVSVEADVFSSLDEFLGFVVSGGFNWFAVLDKSVLFSKLEVSDEFASFDDFAGVSQFFCTTAYCVWKSTGSA